MVSARVPWMISGTSEKLGHAVSTRAPRLRNTLTASWARGRPLRPRESARSDPGSRRPSAFGSRAPSPRGGTGWCRPRRRAGPGRRGPPWPRARGRRRRQSARSARQPRGCPRPTYGDVMGSDPGGAEANDTAERRWCSEGAAEVGALGDGPHARGHGHRGATARASTGERRIPRIAGGAEDRIEGVPPGPELGSVRLADARWRRPP